MAISLPSLSQAQLLVRDPRRDAELKVLQLLHDAYASDPEMLIVYSLRWSLFNASGSESDGEVDFLLIHPELPLIFLEVKGGGIQYNPARVPQWTSTDRNGQTHEIDNPFSQVQYSKNSVIAQLLQDPRFNATWLSGASAAVFPDTADWGPLPHLSNERAIFRDELRADRIPHIIQEVARGARMDPNGAQAQTPKLGHERYLLLKNLLHANYGQAIPISRMIEEEQRSLDERLARRRKLTVSLKQNPRMRISGCAGSGKTLIALQKAVDLVHEKPEQQVLLTCYNLKLGEHLNALLLKESPSARERIRVQPLYPLIADELRACGHDPDSLRGRFPADSDYYTQLFQTFTDIVSDPACDARLRKFDHILIDEAQDMKPEQMDALLGLQKDPNTGVLYLFYDEGQAVHGPDGIPETGLQLLPALAQYPHFELIENLRNTREIARFSERFRQGGLALAGLAAPEVLSQNPAIQGRPPELLAIKTAESGTLDPRDLRNKISIQLTELLHNTPLQGNQLVILTGASREKSALQVGERIGSFVLSDKLLPERKNEVYLETVRKFKGLERAVVLVTEIAGKDPSLWYVAFTRAISHLVIIESEAVLRQIQEIAEGRSPGHLQVRNRPLRSQNITHAAVTPEYELAPTPWNGRGKTG